MIADGTSCGEWPTVLFIGFSVFQPRGLNPRLVEAGRQAGLNIDIVMLGGHTIFSVSHLISEILSPRHPQAVILDLTTSATRGFIGEAQWLLHFDNIIRSIQARGIRTGIVHFLRKDVDYTNDEVVSWCDNYCTEHAVPTRNLALELQASRSAEQIDELINDVVHPKPAGDGFYAARLVEFSQVVLASSAPAPFERVSQFVAIGVPALLGREPDSAIDRHGYPIGLTHLHPGSALRLALPRDVVPRILLVVYGPRSGPLRVLIADDPPLRLRGYDANCYYERLAMEYLPQGAGNAMEVEQLPDLPEEKLLKGEPDLGPRLGKLAYVLGTRTGG